ncbi:hypothetical protein ScalyP_jg3585 [Parmales sp. scaly parma]|nr:hypothetical protein ScalyP_jg3585 [Parmales sp. scaly parma]
MLRILAQRPFASTVLLGGTFATIVGGFKVKEEVGNLEGLTRSLTFYSVGIPAYLKYEYYYRFLNSGSEEHEAEWRNLHASESKKGLDTILKLRGFYIKNGQMCASNIGNAFPKIWQDTMSVLQDGVPPRSYETVKEVIEDPVNGLGQKLGDVFTSFEELPIGSASIGQVHKAVLKKTGERVVVKVQYPDVERVFRGDVRTCIMFCKVAQPVHVPALEEIEKQFMTEFDYRKEAVQLETVRNNLIKSGLGGKKNGICVVPRPYSELCSKNVLVMEELVGEKLVDGLKKDFERYAKSLGKSVAETISDEEEKAEQNEDCERERGPDAKTMAAYLSLLNTKRIAKNVFKACTFRWNKFEGRDTLPLNHAQLVDQLIHIHGHEVLIDGYFNGDPHPGNVLLVGGKLGLIDYGQVKRISNEDRILLARMVIALCEDDKEEVVRLIRAVGYKTKKMNDDLHYIYAKICLDADNKTLTNGLHIQKFMEYLEGEDPIVELPREFVMVSRVSLMLRGLGHALKQPRSIAQCWRPFAERVLREEGVLEEVKK